MSPRLKNWGGHVPRVPHQIAPMVAMSKHQGYLLSAVDRSELVIEVTENMSQSNTCFASQLH